MRVALLVLTLLLTSCLTAEQDKGKLHIVDESTRGIRAALENTKVQDGDLVRLKHYPKVKVVDLSMTDITDSGLKYLKDMPNLNSVALAGTKVTGSGLSYLPDRLEVLDLSNLPIEGKYLKDIGRFKKLIILA